MHLNFFGRHPLFLMEGAIGTRLVGEYNLAPDPNIVLGAHVYNPTARQAISEIYAGYVAAAATYALPFLANTHTRRVNRERLPASGFGERIFSDSVSFLRESCGANPAGVQIGGTVGCRGDAYTGEGALKEDEATAFHSWAIERFAAAGADYVFAALMPTLPEALGVARACSDCGMPYIVSFTLGRNGKMPDGTTLDQAIRRIDDAVARQPLCYMTNCIHPAALAEGLEQECNRTEAVRERFAGIQANAANLPPSSLDGSSEIRKGDPVDLANAMFDLKKLMTMKIVGGCCGTDDKNIAEIARVFSCDT